MRAPSSFRWEPATHGGAWAYSGQRRIGYVSPKRAATRWTWDIMDATPRTGATTSGESGTEDGAKRAFRRAWLRWLADRGLQEIKP